MCVWCCSAATFDTWTCLPLPCTTNKNALLITTHGWDRQTHSYHTYNTRAMGYGNKSSDEPLSSSTSTSAGRGDPGSDIVLPLGGDNGAVVPERVGYRGAVVLVGKEWYSSITPLPWRRTACNRGVCSEPSTPWGRHCRGSSSLVCPFSRPWAPLMAAGGENKTRRLCRLLLLSLRPSSFPLEGMRREDEDALRPVSSRAPLAGVAGEPCC